MYIYRNTIGIDIEQQGIYIEIQGIDIEQQGVYIKKIQGIDIYRNTRYWYI